MHRLLIAAAALALAGCAGTSADSASAGAAPTGRDCFRNADVSGYGVLGNNQVLVRVTSQREYILTTSFDARGLDWSQGIALQSPSVWICVGDGRGRVQVVGGDPPRHYPIDTIERAPQGS